MTAITEAVHVVLDVVWLLVLVQVILSWLISFEVINPRQPQVQKIWGFLHKLLEPLYAPIRRVLPATGMLDLAPLLLIAVLIVLQTLIPGRGLW